MYRNRSSSILCFLAALSGWLVLTAQAPAAPQDTTADAVLGQPGFTHADSNQGGNPAPNTLNHPSGCGTGTAAMMPLMLTGWLVARRRRR